MDLFISPQVERLIEMALDEDQVGDDVTAQIFFGDEEPLWARLVAKEEMVVCGQAVAAAVFRRVDERLVYQVKKRDGEEVGPGEVIAELKGPVRSMLMGERTALNFLQRMSGVATKTSRFVEALSSDETHLVDTRKTLPGWRALDKYAVRCGGGRNHRFNLAAGVMLKDNHVAAAGGVAEAIARARRMAPHTLRIEVEVERLEQLQPALESGAEIIMLDNMSDDEMAEAIKEIRAHQRGAEVVIEASGNITFERLRGLGALGLDVVSVGELTHSVKAADISMLFEEER